MRVLGIHDRTFAHMDIESCIRKFTTLEIIKNKVKDMEASIFPFFKTIDNMVQSGFPWPWDTILKLYHMTKQRKLMQDSMHAPLYSLLRIK